VELLLFYSGSLFKIAHSMLQCETVPPAQRRAEEPSRAKQVTAKFKSGHNRPAPAVTAGRSRFIVPSSARSFVCGDLDPDAV
jgi:hypothetical protein